VPRAFITGITGQDGSYLAELLLSKGYEVHGFVRPGSAFPADFPATARSHTGLVLHTGDLQDAESLRTALHGSAPDEIYHLGAQTHVGKSFENVEATCQTTAIGTLRLLELTRALSRPARFFHASSSEIFGKPESEPQNEQTPVRPVTPYGCAKTFATQLVSVYRRTHGLFACNGILFNHESPRRGHNFVTQKICLAAAAIKQGRQKELVLGSTSAQRDWGDARDYVRGMWLALQHSAPEDFVFATGQLHSVQQVIELAFDSVGLDWRPFLRQDLAFFRPEEPGHLVGDASKASQLLKWKPERTFKRLIREMTEAAEKHGG
jgi:GDPmannose 4,6-dehydratase